MVNVQRVVGVCDADVTGVGRRQDEVVQVHTGVQAEMLLREPERRAQHPVVPPGQVHHVVGIVDLYALENVFGTWRSRQLLHGDFEIKDVAVALVERLKIKVGPGRHGAGVDVGPFGVCTVLAGLQLAKHFGL